jgi:hypothetical protein
MPNHFLLYIGDGDNFWASSSRLIWGTKSKSSSGKGFLNKVEKGDLLWFVKSKSNGQIVAVATFSKSIKRENGPIFDVTPSNEELGWKKGDGTWDTEIHYTQLYNLIDCEMFSEIKGAAPIRLYKSETCKINLPLEYPYIVRYSKVKLSY